MSVIAKVGEFLNTLTMQYELRYKWWINAVVMILSVPHCLCWSFYFQNIITFLFEKLSCAVEILIWSDAVDFLIKLLGMPYSVVTAQQACSTEMVKRHVSKHMLAPCSSHLYISTEKEILAVTVVNNIKQLYYCSLSLLRVQYWKWPHQSWATFNHWIEPTITTMLDKLQRHTINIK